jgi:type IV secretory pathway TrbF-like protein
MLGRKKAKGATAAAEPRTLPPRDPYAAAKQEFNEIHGNAIVQARNWRAVALLTSCIALAAVIGLAVRANQSRFVPYVVEVDKFGAVASVGMADRGEVKDERIIRAFLNRFVADARRVTFDPVMQKQAIHQVFAVLASGTPAHAKMSEHYANTNPFARGQNEGVEADDPTILRINDKAWQIAWTETTRDPQGVARKRETWKATVTVAFNPPTEEAQILVNPLGLFITDFDWRQEFTK